MNWTKLIAIAIAMALVSAGLVHAQTKITAYGYVGDTTWDSKSGNGIGNHDNQLTPFQGTGGVSDAALTASAAQEYGVSVGQTFTVTGANGQTYTLRYEDTAPESDSRIDIYDPSQLLTGGDDNNFETAATSVNDGPVVGSGNVSPAGTIAPGGGQQLTNGSIINTIVAKYEAESANWAQTILKEAEYLFCVLAAISLAWTAGQMALRRADFMEIVAEIMRFIMVTSFFYWLLVAGPALAQDIIRSLQALGDSAASVDGLSPVTIINLGLKVFSNAQTGLLNLFSPGLGIGTFILAAVVMFTCALIGINMVVLLCSAWVLMYAGIIILGFGGCRWTSEMAINYYRAILATGLKLMVMTLIVGIGVNLLQGEIDAVTSWNLMNFAVIAVSALVLLMLSHQLPNMVANIVFGGAVHGAVGNLSAIAMLAVGQQIGMAAARAVAGVMTSGASEASGAGAAADALAKAVQKGQHAAAEVAGNVSGDTGGAGSGAGQGPKETPFNPQTVAQTNQQT